MPVSASSSTLLPSHNFTTASWMSRLIRGLWLIIQYNDEGDMGGGGVLNTTTPQKKLKNTASPQEKSRKHHHRNHFSQNKHITSLFIPHTSTLLIPVNHWVFLILRRNLPRRKQTKKKREARASWDGFYFRSFSSFTSLPFLALTYWLEPYPARKYCFLELAALAFNIYNRLKK